jgi:hypothetical protein
MISFIPWQEQPKVDTPLPLTDSRLGSTLRALGAREKIVSCGVGILPAQATEGARVAHPTKGRLLC